MWQKELTGRNLRDGDAYTFEVERDGKIALVLPSLILMILISKMFMRYMHNRTVESVFKGLRPAVVGLLAAATLLLMTPDNFSTPKENLWQFCISCFLFAASFYGVMFMKINPIRMILYCAVAGLVLLY
jgi:chromate transporter